MTLLVRDERDIVEEQLAFHLAAGVDVAIVTDHASTDGTLEVLERLERGGSVRVLREPDGPFLQREWVTRMARLAATEYDADWVINADADEFWWPRGGSLREVLEAVPRRYGIVQSLVRHFVPVPDDGRPFDERMTYRLRTSAPINDPASPWRPYRKVVHRASPTIELVEGGHAVRSRELQPLRGWYPIECLHFPLRTPAQVERKGRAWGARSPSSTLRRTWRARPGPRTTRSSTTRRRAARWTPTSPPSRCGPDDVERGLAEGLLEEDTRVRDALATVRTGADTLRFERPTTLETASFAVDAAVLGEADVIRTQRWLDDLDRRVGALEARAPVRLERIVRRTIRRVRPG